MEVENDPQVHRRELNQHTGEYAVYYPDRYGQRCWRPEFPDAIERLLDVDVFDPKSAQLRNSQEKYPLVARCAFDSNKINALSPHDRVEFSRQNAMHSLEFGVGSVVDAFLHFRGMCPGCQKEWRNCVNVTMVCFCGENVTLIDTGAASVITDDPQGVKDQDESDRRVHEPYQRLL